MNFKKPPHIFKTLVKIERSEHHADSEYTIESSHHKLLEMCDQYKYLLVTFYHNNI